MPNSPMLMALLVVLSVFASSAKALPKRIVSVNLCTDGLLLTLAPKQRIAAVSQYARKKNLSPFTELARDVPAVSVQAEAILALKPDLVIAGKYGARETIKQLQRLGIPVEKFAPVQNFAELEEQIARLGNLIGEPERAQDLIAQVKQFDTSTPPVASKRRGAIYFGSGVSPGSNTMEGRVLELAGIENITATHGRKGIAYLPLEEFIVARPEILVLTDYHQHAPSRAQRFQQHPVFRRMQQSTVVLPANLLTCGGGSWTKEAVNRLREFTAEANTVRNAVDLSSAKPSPAGEGWVRGNQNKEKSLCVSPHPSLVMPDCPVRHPAGKCKSAPGGFVPEGEGAHTLKSTVLSTVRGGL